MANVETRDGIQTSTDGEGIQNANKTVFMSAQSGMYPNLFIIKLQLEHSKNRVRSVNGLPLYGMHHMYWNRVLKSRMSNPNHWNDGAHSLTYDDGIIIITIMYHIILYFSIQNFFYFSHSMYTNHRLVFCVI